MTEQFSSTLPKEFIRNTVELCGERGQAWLDKIPEIVSGLEQSWSIKAGKHFRHLSYNYVANATTADGNPAVLKLALPLQDVEIYGEAEYLRTLNGEGAVKLLQFDREKQAVLIEKCVPGKNLRSVCRNARNEAVPIAIDVLKRILRPVPASQRDLIKLDDWFDGLKRAAGTKFPLDYAERALNYYQELSSDRENQFLLHGDLHHENILSATREPFLVIDPKGIIGHVAYDIGVFLNNHANWLDWDTRLQTRVDQAIDEFASAFRLPEEIVRKAAFCQMVLSWWWMFDEMPALFEDELGLSDIWKV
jgi:streptomycin 6-kinase